MNDRNHPLYAAGLANRDHSPFSVNPPLAKEREPLFPIPEKPVRSRRFHEGNG